MTIHSQPCTVVMVGHYYHGNNLIDGDFNLGKEHKGISFFGQGINEGENGGRTKRSFASVGAQFDKATKMDNGVEEKEAKEKDGQGMGKQKTRSTMPFMEWRSEKHAGEMELRRKKKPGVEIET